jgi:hypothetical protein
MTETELSPRWITGAVFQAWATGIADELPTVYPGVTVTTAGWEAWYEIWVDQLAARPQRSRAPELSDVQVTVHAFVRTTTDQGRIHELMRRAQAVLSGQTLVVVDTDVSGTPTRGYVKLGTALVKELTRLDADASRHGLQHSVAVWRGIAQRVISP